MKSQSIVAFGEPLESTISDTPVPTGNQVLLKVTHCGVCHSDVHLHDGHFDMGGGNKLEVGANMKLPFTLGHEIEGTVAAVGPDVTTAKEGDARVAFPWIGCGQCATCQRGEEQLCNRPAHLGVGVPGGFADYVLIPHEKYLLDYTGVPQGLAATYMCSGLTAFSALKKIGTPAPDDAILIVGLGGVGMMGLQFAKALFNCRIMATDINEEKLAEAEKAGAVATFNAKDADAAKQIKGATDGGVYAAIDFVGSEPSFGLARASLRKGGRAVVVGLFGGAFTMPIPLLPMQAHTLQGSFVGSLDETKEMLAMVQAGAVDPIPITERPISAATDTLDDLRNGNIMGRVVLTP
ncbi:MAG: alcohol dehydrogenase [Alphaproteobacteria bacterium]|nr:MAG: alcohol dehydrogenase [Alphaproteobacteria bacterium]